MKTVLLAGGFGTRIRDVAADIPKPMLSIGPYPILVHIMKIYAMANFRHFIVALGYKGDVLKQYFLNFGTNTHDLTVHLGGKPKVTYHRTREPFAANWKVTLVDTGEKAMTGARVRAIRTYLSDDETFMLTYGDGVGDIPIRDLLAFHKRHGKILTITGVRPPGRFGELAIKNQVEVIGFNEKPQATGGMISGGFFVCDRRVFDYLDGGEDLVFEQGPIQRLTSDGQVAVFQHKGFWHAMDTHRDYVYLNDIWEKGTAPWKTW